MPRPGIARNSRDNPTHPPESASPPVPEGSRFTAKLALAGVVITVAGTIGAAVLTNWDKLFGPKPTPAAAPSQVSTGAQSTNISGARDVTINNGTAVEKKPVSNVAGKWTTSVITNSAENSEHSRLVLEFVQADGTLSGSVTETGQDGRNPDTVGLLEGKVSGKAVSFYTRGEVDGGDGPTSYKESYFGIVNDAGTEIAFSRVDDLPPGSQPEKFIAKRMH
jgi:hypothetical protein